MRYPNCEKAKAFNLFDQRKRPSEIFKLVKVKEHTLFNYYQLWKREQEEENKRKRLAAEHQQRLEKERKERERKQEEEMWTEGMADAIRRQQQTQLENKYKNQKKIVRELKAQMARAASIPNNDKGIQRVGEVYSQEFEKLRELTRILYSQQADEKSINIALWQKKD